MNVESRGRNPLVVGLTGGIGSGKSAAAEEFARLGAAIVDTDEISRALTAAGGAAMEDVARAFGREFVTPDGALDRAAMRALAFRDAQARARLEAILHPAIRRASDGALEAAQGPYAVLVIPLLFETGGPRDRLDRTLVVDCPEALQVARVMRRSQLEEAEVRAILAAQWPRWRRLQMADDVVWNGSDLAHLARQCEKRHHAYCETAYASPTIPPKSGRGR